MTADEVVARLADLPAPTLIAIDGLPCSGKSTLAERIQSAYGFECLYLDDFVRPRDEWPSRSGAAFPFEYIRYNEFTDAIRMLASKGQCTYLPFDFETLTISREPKTLRLTRPVMVEGVSSLNTAVVELYGLKIFVDSDRSTTLETAIRRGGGRWSEEWRDLFLPSADLYMQSHPELRADLIVRGRGAI
jgi:uridine kinase